MDEKELLKGGEISQETDTVQPEPETNETAQSISEEQKEANEKIKQILETVSAVKAEAKPKEAPEEPQLPEEKEPTEIELVTVRRLTPEQKRVRAQKRAEAEKKKKFRLLKKIVAVGLVIVLVVACGILYAEYTPNRRDGEVIITIPEEASTAQIASILKQENLIGSKHFYRVMSKIRGIDGKYNYGKFTLDLGYGYEQIFDTLTRPGEVTNSVDVLIPEGSEIYKIADILEEKGLIDRDRFFYLVENGEFDYDFIKEIPEREYRLEGYLFPSTYRFVPGEEEDIINEMLMQFEKHYAPYAERAEEMGMTMDEVITLASVIEREAQGDYDRKLVSSVFHNRLKSTDYPYLQSCATVQYVLKERKAVLSVADTKIDSPYNTYINKGLPIGPIASPGEKSIEAALYPEESEYLFFVLGSDGKHHFSKTYSEHMQNKNN